MSTASTFILLRDAEVFAPEPLGRVDVLVAAGRIALVGPDLPSLPPALGAEEIDCGGRRLLPGLIDAHVHVTGGGGESGPGSRVPPIVLESLTEAGVTTAIGVLGTDGTTRSIESLVARTLGLREEGLSAWCYTGSYELPLRTLTGSVRRDLVFVDPIVGVGELAISDHRSSQPTLDELLRIAADAHVGGLMSGKAGIVHLHLGDGPRGLDLIRRALDQAEIPARVLQPTHVNRNKPLFEEALELAARGCHIDLTAFPPEPCSGGGGFEPGLSATDAIERYLGSGLPRDLLTCSSDGSGCLPVFDTQGQMVSMDVGRPASLASTLTELLARGHAPSVIAPIFTSNIARHLRLPRKGRVTAGADADILLLDMDGHISDVMALGRFLVRQGRFVVRGRFSGGGDAGSAGPAASR